MWSKHWSITAVFFVSGQSVTADRYTEYVSCCPLPHTPTPENYLTIRNKLSLIYLYLSKLNLSKSKRSSHNSKNCVLAV